jgi:hypothetical protein
MKTRHGVPIGVILLFLASCVEGNPFATVEDFSPGEAQASNLPGGAALLACPAREGRSTTAVIGPLGGVLELDGHSMLVPGGAVLDPTSFKMVVPASPHLEIQVTAEGHSGFVFERPVTLSISYARCPREDLQMKSLRIFYIDAQTKEILADHGGDDNKLLRRVTALSGHLSGYSVGSN